MKKPPLNLPWRVSDPGSGSDCYIQDSMGHAVVSRSEADLSGKDHERLMHYLCELVNNAATAPGEG